MRIQDIRKMFPALSQTVYGKPLVYFDNAATAQRPESVVRKMESLALGTNANIHRAVHKLASEATEEYETTRDVVREYITAESRQEVVFTSGTTASINLVAFSFGEVFVGEGDEIIVSEEEHHSNIVPWQMLCQRKKATLKVLRVDDEGHLKINDLTTLITSRTKIVAVTHISNVLGIINPVKEIVNICHSKGCPVLIDGAQGIVHQKVDVQDLDCDFYAFSGHKIYAATGTGVLYGKKKWLEQMVPYQGGGEMIETVKFSGTTYAPEDSELRREMGEVEERFFASLRMTGSKVFGVPRGTERKIPLCSFTVGGAHHEDVALILDKMGIAVRSGQMCAEPLMDRFGVTGMLRVSLAPYNTVEEVEYFEKALDKAIKMLV